MASFFHFFFFFFSIVILCFYSNAANAARSVKPDSFLLPIKKDTKALQYYTSVGVGTPAYPVDAVIDLGSGLLWFDCDSGFTSSSYKPVPCGSQKCEVAKGIGCVGCNGPARPGCTNDTCGVFPFNPYIDRLLSAGLYEDTFHLGSTKVTSFPFSCVDKEQIGGLASGAEGILGLSRAKIAPQIHLSSAFNIPPKFSLCLPSGSKLGKLTLGVTKGNSNLLTLTPLTTNPVSTAPIFSEGDASDEYFIDVKAVKIEGKDVSFKKSLLSIDSKGIGGTKIRTLTNFTTLHTSIFRAVANQFASKASSMKISRVAAVAPFGACFSSKTIKSTKTGPAVPEIELVLPGRIGPVSWKIYGANSMVRVNEKVMCLAFVDGGKEPQTSIVIGGHQLEDNLLEFDLSTSILGFSSSLLLHDTSCSH